jgi:hypothetical protein
MRLRTRIDKDFGPALTAASAEGGLHSDRNIGRRLSESYPDEEILC